MMVAADFVDAVMTHPRAALRDSAADPVVGRYVDTSLPIPRPFLGNGEIRLVIIGQDPTVRNMASRQAVTTVLNCDKPGNLRTFLTQFCGELGISLDKQVYATNVCKGFFKSPPTEIKAVDVIAKTARYWLPILNQELAQFPDAVVVSLGEPVLSVLVRDGFPKQVKHYWGYRNSWKRSGFISVCPVPEANSTIGRTIFPYIHQPTRAEFYRVRRDDFLACIRDHLQRDSEERHTALRKNVLQFS